MQWPGIPLEAYVRRLDVFDWRRVRRDVPRDIGELLAIVRREESAIDKTISIDACYKDE